MSICLMPFASEHMTLLQTWLQRDHVKRWYEHPEDWITEAAGRDDVYRWIRHFILYHQAVLFGFCQYYPYSQGDETWHGNLPTRGTYSMDYLIGEPAYLRKGYAREAIAQLLQRIASQPDAERVIVQPDAENEASCQTLLSAGFTYDAENRLFRIDVQPFGGMNGT